MDQDDEARKKAEEIMSKEDPSFWELGKLTGRRSYLEIKLRTKLSDEERKETRRELARIEEYLSKH